MPQEGRVEGLAGVRGVYEKMRGAIRGVVVGKDGVLDLALVSLFAGGDGCCRVPRFGDGVPAALAEDFDRLEPRAFGGCQLSGPAYDREIRVIRSGF